MEYRIGAGGWAYFDVPEESSLEAYSRAFDFVEVNSTYYEMPSRETAVRWRKTVPAGFEFTLRAHRALGDSGFEASEANRSALEEAQGIAATLRAPAIHLLWPRGRRVTSETIANFRELLGSVPDGGPRFALEVREPNRGPPAKALASAMRDLEVLHVFDLSREAPVPDQALLYTRLFGKGEGNRYQFTDEELRELDAKAERSSAEKALFTFHGVRMYKDAGRFSTFKKTGRFPRVTQQTGIPALREALREDARFPSSKADLLRDQGWKVVDWEEGRRLHISEVLGLIPEGTYSSVREVLDALPGPPS